MSWPALLTRISIFRQSRGKRSSNFATDSSSVTSSFSAMAASPSSAASDSSCGSRRAAQITRAPASARVRAVCSPIPALAPVTKAIFPSRCPIDFVSRDAVAPVPDGISPKLAGQYNLSHSSLAVCRTTRTTTEQIRRFPQPDRCTLSETDPIRQRRC